MQKSKLICLLLFVCLASEVCARDPFGILVEHETKQRKMAGLSENEYHLLPFRLSGEKQHFIQAP